MKQSEIDFVTDLGAGKLICTPALEYLNTQSSLQKAWENCVNSDWMLWYLLRVLTPGSENYSSMILALVDIVQPLSAFVEGDDKKLFSELRAATRAFARKGTAKTKSTCRTLIDKSIGAMNSKWGNFNLAMISMATRYCATFLFINYSYTSIIDWTNEATLCYKGLDGTEKYKEEEKLLKKQADVFRKYFPKLPKKEI